MGIFDDAIRQHLDLKRRQGADESELQQLEDEAFGLPARPGDPDFPATGESDGGEGEGAGDGAEAAPPDREAESSTPEAETASSHADPKPREEPAPHGDALLSEPDAEPQPPATEEGPVEDSGAPAFTTSEREAISEQPTEFFDRAPGEFELGDLDLDLEEEVDEVGSIDEPETGEGNAESSQPGAEASEARPEAEPEQAEAEAPSEEPAPEDDPESVLEETPEFLRDNPDDDELWFEQGEPKDFDF